VKDSLLFAFDIDDINLKPKHQDEIDRLGQYIFDKSTSLHAAGTVAEFVIHIEDSLPKRLSLLRNTIVCCQKCVQNLCVITYPVLKTKFTLRPIQSFLIKCIFTDFLKRHTVKNRMKKDQFA